MYTKNELLFPHYVIASLRNLRGEEWQQLVARVLAVPEGDEMSLAFVLMMIRLDGCLACETDSYRAMRGCAACATQTLRRYKGSDRELTRLFQAALEDIRRHLHGRSLENDDDVAAVNVS
ncbi:MAG TPA: hypothetical protein PLD47_02415 [Aggregatilineales bacterium]|nr:hypothetical protein [Anaerolineales bacterium]HRE46553.1 hypothetical protein [Aggregatilineales bacterium]